MGAVRDLNVDQGATVRIQAIYRYQSGVDGSNQPVYTGYSLTGCTARMQVRQRIGDPVIFELTTENGGIELQRGAVAGRIDITMSAAQTTLLEFKKAVYDFELIWPSGDVARLLQGKITISLNVTE